MQTEEHKWGRPGNETKFWVPIKIIRLKAEMVSILFAYNWYREFKAVLYTSNRVSAI